MNGLGLTSYKFNAFHTVVLKINLLENRQTQQIYRVSQEEWTKFRESVPFVELYRYNI